MGSEEYIKEYKSEKVTILCTAYCKHNSGFGYYNICNHPLRQNIAPYGGITRSYVDTCACHEQRK